MCAILFSSTTSWHTKANISVQYKPVGLSEGAVAGHIKRAAALNARRVSTRSILNLWRNQ